MDNLDIQIVDSLTVNLNQEEYSTEGQVLNTIDVYVEDEQLLFEAALTQDSINLYTRETPDIISFDTKGIMDGISKLESLIEKTSKEATLLAKVAELKEALNTIDFTTIEQAIQDVKGVTAKEATLIQGVGDIIRAVENIDFTEIENSIAEVKNAVVNIDFSALAKETTLTQGLSSVESKVEEESVAIQSKIDNIDLSGVAKQGENQDATNTAIYALLSQFGESVLQEKVTVILNCQENIVWQNYAVSVTFEDGRVQAVPLSENGTCSFSIKIGQNYSVQLPILGVFISPELRTYTAITSSREIYWSYISAGIFGIDELGKRYTTSQIEALENKSIIKYGGYTNEAFESYQNDDGTFGCGFMWRLEEENCIFSGLITPTGNTQFPEDLLPYYVDDKTEKTLLDGKAYTDYIINTCVALGGRSELAEESKEQSITIGKQMYNGYILAYYQLRYLISNKSGFDNFYNTLGITIPKITGQTLVTSRVRNSLYMLGAYGDSLTNVRKGKESKCFVAFPLPK